MTKLLLKIQKRGLRWFLWRLRSELIHPQAGHLADTIYALRRFHFSLKALIKKGKPTKKTSIYAVYDLTIAPITYNLAEFLIYADLKAKTKGFSKFSLIIVNRLEKKYNYEYDAVIDLEKKKWRLQNLLLPLALNFESCENVLVCSDFPDLITAANDSIVLPEIYSSSAPAYYNNSEFLELTRNHNIGIGFKASSRALNYIDEFCKEMSLTKLITITLRDYDYDTGRNSNIEEWGKFTEWLIGENYSVVVIPDAEKPFHNYDCFPNGIVQSIFCWNLSLRLALYERAIINFGMPNGPMALAMSSKFSNVVIMKYQLGYSEIFQNESHLAVPSYCKENHFFIDSIDNFTNLQSAFKTTIDRLNESPSGFLDNKC